MTIQIPDDLRCCICQKTNAELAPKDDVRPYGPGGQPICYGCAMATPERKAGANRLLNKRYDEIEAKGGIPGTGDDFYGIVDITGKADRES